MAISLLWLELKPRNTLTFTEFNGRFNTNPQRSSQRITPPHRFCSLSFVSKKIESIHRLLACKFQQRTIWFYFTRFSFITIWISEINLHENESIVLKAFLLIRMRIAKWKPLSPLMLFMKIKVHSFPFVDF